MKVDMDRQLNGYGEQLDEEVKPFMIEDLINRQVVSVRGGVPLGRRWPVAVASAAVVLLVVGGVVGAIRLFSEAGPVTEQPVSTTLMVPLPESMHDWAPIVDTAVFDGKQEAEVVISGVVRGGPGLVAVGSWDYASDVHNGDSYTVVWTSSDGVIWTRLPFDDEAFRDTRFGGVTAHKSGFVAVGSSRPVGSEGREDGCSACLPGVPEVWTSEDGIDWVRHQLDQSVFSGAQLSGIASDGSVLVAGGQSCPPPDAECSAAAWTSTDGVTWTQATTPGITPSEIEWVESFARGFVAIGGTEGISPGTEEVTQNGLVWFSTDGHQWQEANNPEVFRDICCMRAASWGQGLIAIGYGGDGSGLVWSSPDGTNWERIAEEPDLFQGFYSEVLDVGGQIMVLSELAGEIGGFQIWTSTDGVSWENTIISTDTEVFVEAATIGGPGLIAVGHRNGFEGMVWVNPATATKPAS